MKWLFWKTDPAPNQIPKCVSGFEQYDKLGLLLESALNSAGHRAIWSSRHSLGRLWCTHCGLDVEAKHLAAMAHEWGVEP